MDATHDAEQANKVQRICNNPLQSDHGEATLCGMPGGRAKDFAMQAGQGHWLTRGPRLVD